MNQAHSLSYWILVAMLAAGLSACGDEAPGGLPPANMTGGTGGDAGEGGEGGDAGDGGEGTTLCLNDTRCPDDEYCNVPEGENRGACEPGCRENGCLEGETCDLESRDCLEGEGGAGGSAGEGGEGGSDMMPCRFDSNCPEGFYCDRADSDNMGLCVEGARPIGGSGGEGGVAGEGGEGGSAGGAGAGGEGGQGGGRVPSGLDNLDAVECGGEEGIECEEGLICVDPNEMCDPNAGNADCIGVCVVESARRGIFRLTESNRGTVTGNGEFRRFSFRNMPLFPQPNNITDIWPSPDRVPVQSIDGPDLCHLFDRSIGAEVPISRNMRLINVGDQITVSGLEVNPDGETVGVERFIIPFTQLPGGEGDGTYPLAPGAQVNIWDGNGEFIRVSAPGARYFGAFEIEMATPADLLDVSLGEGETLSRNGNTVIWAPGEAPRVQLMIRYRDREVHCQSTDDGLLEIPAEAMAWIPGDADRVTISLSRYVDGAALSGGNMNQAGAVEFHFEHRWSPEGDNSVPLID